jgi:hypothetical protein
MGLLPSGGWAQWGGRWVVCLYLARPYIIRRALLPPYACAYHRRHRLLAMDNGGSYAQYRHFARVGGGGGGGGELCTSHVLSEWVIYRTLNSNHVL